MRKSVLLLATVCAILSLSAQEKTFNGALVWKISGNGLKAPSYVFGTYHLITGDYADSVPGLKEAMTATGQVVGELNLLNQQEGQAKVMQASMLAPEDSYKTHLSADDYTLLDSKLKDLMGVGLEQMGALKPGALGPVILMVLYTSLDPAFNPNGFEGIDAYLQRTGDADGKNVIGLETLDDQIEVLFNATSQKRQMESLVCSMQNLDHTVGSLARLTESYKKGDIHAIYTSAYETDDEPCLAYSLETKAALLDNRNAQWMKKLPALMAESPSLIAVGALHLTGKEGLLYQLDKLGYKVEAMR